MPYLACGSGLFLLPHTSNVQLLSLLLSGRSKTRPFGRDAPELVESRNRLLTYATSPPPDFASQICPVADFVALQSLHKRQTPTPFATIMFGKTKRHMEEPVVVEKHAGPKHDSNWMHGYYWLLPLCASISWWGMYLGLLL